MRIVVVGGGISGLAAARRLEAIDPGTEVVVIEREDAPGGKLRTEHVAGFVVEAAPDSFLARKPRGVGLCDDLGLSDELIARRPENHGSFVRRGHELLPLPEGLTGMIPTNLDALDESALLSGAGRARFREEPDVPALESDEDESIGSFVSRRFGREAYEALMEPLVTGIYGGDGDRLSLAATFPQLRAVERASGSVLRGLSARPGGGEPTAPFLSLRSGMETLVEALVRSFRRTRIERARATRIRTTSSGFDVELDGGALEADGVVVATPAHVTAELLVELDPVLADEHTAIPYGSSVVVTLAFDSRELPVLEGYGYVVPRIEGTDALACTWSSEKWEGRAPDGAALARVYLGRFGGRDLLRADNAELISVARDELRMVGVEATPMLTRVHRWPLAMPQYVLGHPERVARIEDGLGRHPGLELAGAAYRGVGIPDCIASGEAAAESVVRSLAAAPA